jgi:predicted 2-oxoglutarate/Fe(II)-dependent dioxygenase YbiX
VLIVPRVFSPDFCRQLIGLFESSPHQETGIVSQSGERTTIVVDPDFKRRRDCRIEDPQLISTLKEILRRRLLPEIAKAFQFQASHIERHIVSRYAAGEQGHFRAHRDNHSRGTAHRRFAATINLNREFEGGALSFPEFGARGFNAPPGGAMVFSCSLLHAVSVVTKGLRYAYLPFFYDEAGARILEANRASWTHEHLAPGAEALARF